MNVSPKTTLGGRRGRQNPTPQEPGLPKGGRPSKSEGAEDATARGETRLARFDPVGPYACLNVRTHKRAFGQVVTRVRSWIHAAETAKVASAVVDTSGVWEMVRDV